MLKSEEFVELVTEKFPQISRDAAKKVADFYFLVIEANAQQNLTRIIDPDEFIERNLSDALAVINSGELAYPALDLGSGFGVPGLLCAILSPGEWILSESESLKADFLMIATKKLGLDAQIRVFSGRAEDFLAKNRVGCIVSRAVGSIDKIMSWVGKCSTWNKMILLKGPRWDQEWDGLRLNLKKQLVIKKMSKYSNKYSDNLALIILDRVPRGTRQ